MKNLIVEEKITFDRCSRPSFHDYPPRPLSKTATHRVAETQRIESKAAVMAFPRARLITLPLLPSLFSTTLKPLLPISPFRPRPPVRSLAAFASVSASETQDPPAPRVTPPRKTGKRWKPMCLYYTQGKCTMMEDPMHMEKFNHNCSRDLEVTNSMSNGIRFQNLDFFLVLDLEGKVEILEFPVLMIDAKTMNVVDIFHRFVRPTEMGETRINEYIEGKYGKFGVDRVWHDTAIPFKDVLQQFEAWLIQHRLWGEELGGCLYRAAFVTCGNWDLKTKVPQQCKVSRMKLPSYFMEWINLKDVYLNFYKRRATGMMTMMKELQIPLLGSHHLGFDDSKNIARVLQHMLADGAVIQISARRNPDSLENVEFLFKNRIR